MARPLIAFLTAFLFIQGAAAQDLGIHGAIYKVAEPDMLALIEGKAKEFVDSGRYERWKQESIDRATKSITEPAPVPMSALPTHSKRTWDPTVVVKENVVDHQGNVIVPAGTMVNPLDIVRMTEPLLFIDGREEKQVQWAVRMDTEKPSKIVLVAGSWIDLSRKLGRRVFYDLNGWMTAKFGITSVPAIVMQADRLLSIEEGISE